MLDRALAPEWTAQGSSRSSWQGLYSGWRWWMAPVIQAASHMTEKTTDPTERQGQFLAYIHYYSLVNGWAPAEADIQRFFRITPPSVHTMVLTLERRGFIRRVPGQARSITLIVPPESLPPLRRVQS